MNKYLNLKEKISSVKALLVEDDADVNNEEVLFLKKFFSAVDSAHNGADGLKMIENNSYKVLFADIKMPIMDGWELIRRVKNIKPEIFIIILTASRKNEERIDPSLYNLYFEKPIGFEDMVFIMGKIIQEFKL